MSDDVCSNYDCPDKECVRHPKLNWLERRRLKEHKDIVPTYNTLTHEYEETEIPYE